MVQLNELVCMWYIYLCVVESLLSKGTGHFICNYLIIMVSSLYLLVDRFHSSIHLSIHCIIHLFVSLFFSIGHGQYIEEPYQFSRPSSGHILAPIHPVVRLSLNYNYSTTSNDTSSR